MYCQHCGSKLPEDAALCPRCGTQQKKRQETLISPAFSTQEFNAVNTPVSPPPPKKRPLWIPLLLPVMLVFCIGLALTAQYRLPMDGSLPLYAGESAAHSENTSAESTEPAGDSAPSDSLPENAGNAGSEGAAESETQAPPSAWGDMPDVPAAESTPEGTGTAAALAQGLSPDGVTSAPHTDAVLAAAAPLEKATVYAVSVDTPTLRLRAQPTISAEVLDQLYSSGSRFYGLHQQDGWVYGVYLGQTGWCALEYLTPASEVPLPDFLSASEQCRYLQALSLYNGCTVGGSPGRNHADTREINGLRYCSSRSFQGSYDRLCAVLGDVFVTDVALRLFLSGSFYPVDDQLYELDADGGSILAILHQYTQFRLDGRGEERIVFTQLATYKDDYDQHLYTMEWPVVLVKGVDGVWRCEVITSAVYGDLLAE
ncbi:MAG: zinc-ribbon domain-containing protein [Oscillospiraceae bacterium]|nr:zinc-ribbon domain-containing protein [Oscillospiraceae bacterium]